MLAALISGHHFLDLGLLMRGERFRGLLLRWRNFLTEVG